MLCFCGYLSEGKLPFGVPFPSYVDSSGFLSLKEKVARSLIPQEQFLAGSYYGKFFSRNLNLYLLKRRPDEWKTFQSNKKAVANSTASALNNNSYTATEAGTSILNGEPPNAPPSKKKRKRETRAKDEIDELFDHSNKRAKGDKATAATPRTKSATDAVSKEKSTDTPVDKELKDVFNAIRDAPKGDKKAKELSGKSRH